MLNDNAIQAFSNAAGVPSETLSLFIRTSLMGGFFIWAAWCALELFKHYKNQQNDNISHLIGQYVQLFFLISVVTALVFIH
jgi:hypothetical protein